MLIFLTGLFSYIVMSLTNEIQPHFYQPVLTFPNHCNISNTASRRHTFQQKKESIDKARLNYQCKYSIAEITSTLFSQFHKHVSGRVIECHSCLGSPVSLQSFASRWMPAFLNYNTIGLSMFTVLLCIVRNEIGIRSLCLAQWNGRPHPRFIPYSNTGFRNPAREFYQYHSMKDLSEIVFIQHFNFTCFYNK